MLAEIPLILLAGGRSSRLGKPKGLVRIGEQTWLELQCSSFRELGGQRIFLILGYELEAYSGFQLEGVEILKNPDPEYGPFSSIQTGAKRALILGAPGVFVLPIDVPVPKREVWTALSEAFFAPTVPRICQPVVELDGRVRAGHPVLVSAQELRTLSELPPSGRLDYRIRGLGAEEVKRVSVQDQMILKNLNTAEDWNQFRRARQ